MASAPSITSLGSTVISTTGTAAVPVPSGVVSTSLVVVWFWAYWVEISTVPTSAAFSPSAGFVLADFHAYLDTTVGFYTASAWYYKYATGADSGTYSFGISSVGGTSPAKSFGTAFRISDGPGSGSPFVDSFEFTSSSTATSSVNASAFTPGGDYSFFLGGYVAPQATSVTLPSGWVTDASTVFNGAVGIQAIGHASQTTATNTGTLTFSATGTASTMFAHLGVIRPPLPATPWLRFN